MAISTVYKRSGYYYLVKDFSPCIYMYFKTNVLLFLLMEVDTWFYNCTQISSLTMYKTVGVSNKVN